MTQQNTTDWDAIEKIALPMANGVTDGRVTGDDYLSAFTAGIGDMFSGAGSGLGWLEAKAPALPFKNVSEALKAIGASISDPQQYDLPDEGMHRLLLQGTRSLPNNLTLLIPAYGAAGLAAKTLGISGGLAAAVGGVVGSRPIESMYNAGETFDEAKARGLTDDEAIEAANYVFKEDFKSGAIIDAFQFGLTFGKLFKGAKDVPVDKIAKQVVGKLRPFTKAVLAKLGISAFDVVSQGIEEGLQAIHQIDALEGKGTGGWDDPRVVEAAQVGGLMGGVFGGVGAISEAAQNAWNRPDPVSVSPPVTPPSGPSPLLLQAETPSTILENNRKNAWIVSPTGEVTMPGQTRPPIPRIGPGNVAGLLPPAFQRPGEFIGRENGPATAPLPVPERNRIDRVGQVPPINVDQDNRTVLGNLPQIEAEEARIEAEIAERAKSDERIGIQVVHKGNPGRIINIDEKANRASIRFSDGKTRNYKLSSPWLQDQIKTVLANQGGVAVGQPYTTPEVTAEPQRTLALPLGDMPAALLPERTVPQETVAPEPRVEETVPQGVEPQSQEQVRAVLKKRLRGDALENAVDLARDLQEKGGVIDENGRAVLYHRTTASNAQAIIADQAMTSKEDGLFFGTRPTGQIEGYGEAVVEVSIPLEQIELNDIFTNEAHVRMPTRSIGKKVAVEARIPVSQNLEAEAVVPQAAEPQAEPQSEVFAKRIKEAQRANLERIANKKLSPRRQTFVDNMTKRLQKIAYDTNVSMELQQEALGALADKREMMTGNMNKFRARVEGIENKYFSGQYHNTPVPTRSESSSNPFTYNETQQNKDRRINAGYDNIVTINAQKFQSAYELQNKEPLAWNQGRSEALDRVSELNDYPKVSNVNGHLQVSDGRHRIAAAAKRGVNIDVATPSQVEVSDGVFKPHSLPQEVLVEPAVQNVDQIPASQIEETPSEPPVSTPKLPDETGVKGPKLVEKDTTTPAVEMIQKALRSGSFLDLVERFDKGELDLETATKEVAKLATPQVTPQVAPQVEIEPTTEVATEPTTEVDEDVDLDEMAGPETVTEEQVEPYTEEEILRLLEEQQRDGFIDEDVDLQYMSSRELADMIGRTRELETYYSLKEAEGGGVTFDDVQKALPNATLFAIDNVWVFEMPNGMRGVILPNGDIALDRAAAEKAYGRPISENEVPVGSWSIMDDAQVITLAGNLADPWVLNHEVFEMAMHMSLTPDEVAIVESHFGTSEAAADGYADFVEHRSKFAKTRLGRIFQRIMDFFKNVQARLFGDSVESVLLRVESGEVFLRENTVPIDNQTSAFRVTEDGSVVVADENIQRIIDDVRTEDRTPQENAVVDELKNNNWVIMTAENPQSTEATPEFNQEANAKLEEVLKERGYQYEPVRGNYGGADEHSFWIKGITLQEGLDLARQFDQSSVMTPGGLAYTSGLVQPATGLNVNADINEYFSEVQRDGQNVRFQYDINWDGGYYILEHHSQARGLTKLDTEFSGTGKPGSENKVRQAYPEIFKNRIYMYRANPKAVEHGLGANRYKVTVPENYVVDFTRGGPDRQLYYAEAKSIFNENGYNYTGEDANGSNLKALNGKAMPLPGTDMGRAITDHIMQQLAIRDGFKAIRYGDSFMSFVPVEAQQIGMNVPIGIPSMGGETYYKVKLANGKEIPNWMTVMKPSVLKFLTKEEVAKWNITSANSFNEWMKILPSAQEIASWAWAGRAKRGWYRYTNKVFNMVFGSDTHRVSLLMAALSPQCGVEINVENTMRVWTAWLKDTENRNNLIKDLESKGEKFWWVEEYVTEKGNKGQKLHCPYIEELIANNVREDPARADDPDYNGPALPAWIPNAIRALVAEDPLTVTLSGPKVDSFAANLVGYQRAVTNDTHQADLFGIPQKELGGSINRAGTDPGRSPAYLALSAITRKAADILTRETGEVWTAAEVQETTWSLTKWLKDKLAKVAKSPKEFTELLFSGNITHGDIASVPDLGTLLQTPLFREMLKEVGYGSQLEGLKGTSFHTDPEVGGGVNRASWNTSVATNEGLPQGLERTFRRNLERSSERIGRIVIERRETSRNADTSTATPEPAPAPEPQPVAFALRKKKTLPPSQVRQLIDQQQGERVVDTPTRDPRTLKERVKDGFASFRSQWVDSLYPLLYTIGSKQLYERAWVETRGAIGRADKLVQYGNDNTKSLTEILKDVPENEHRDFMQYCVNRHLESLARDVESGRAKNVKQLALSSKEYKANADAIQQLRPEWEQKRKDLVRFQQEALLYLVEGGIMSKETYDNMIQTRPDYMPLTREFTPEELDGLVRGIRSRGLVDLSNPLKTLKGSKRAVVDPLQQILKNVYLFAEMGSRNSVGQDVAQMVDSGEIDTTIIAPSDGVATGKDRRVFHVWRDGVKTFFETDPDIYRALAAPDYESSGFVARILQKPTSWLRFGATRSPDFMMRNMIRDALHASVFSENGFVPFLDNFRGLMHAINKDALFQEFLESGASQSTLVSLDRDVLKKRFQDIMKENGGFKMTALLNPKTALDILSTLSEYSELSTRLGEFGKARAKGLTLHDSALAARDVSLDFHRSGSKGRVVNQYVAFFNAGVQGIDKMVRGFYDYSTPGLKKKERIKPATFKRALMYITLPSLALYFANMSDPERREVYEELPQWQRDLFWCFVMKNEAKTVIRIPKPFEIGIIFGSMAERFLDWTYNKDPRAFKEMGDTFSTFLPGVMPTAVAPIIEWMTNYSFFLERSLVPMGEERLPAEQQYGPHTSQTAKGLGVLLENIPGVRNIAEFSPRKIDSLINSYTGGLGRYAVDYFGDPVASAFMDEEPSKPAKHLHEKLPGVKGLTTTAYRSPESVQRFFDLKDEINKGVAGDKNKGRPVKNEALNKKINDLARKIAEVRKKQKLVRESTMSPEDKRRQLDILDNRILSLAQQGVGFAERYGF